MSSPDVRCKGCLSGVPQNVSELNSRQHAHPRQPFRPRPRRPPILRGWELRRGGWADAKEGALLVKITLSFRACLYGLNEKSAKKPLLKFSCRGQSIPEPGQESVRSCCAFLLKGLDGTRGSGGNGLAWGRIRMARAPSLEGKSPLNSTGYRSSLTKCSSLNSLPSGA